jgi:hypothetical protein
MQQEKMARLLPEIFQATAGQQGPLDAFLAAQVRLHEPCEAAIGSFADHLDPRTAAPAFVYMLARWVDLDYLVDGPAHTPHFAGGVGRLRALIATVARNGRERGTGTTLIRLLETATGISGFRIEPDAAIPFHFTLFAPRDAVPFKGLVKRLLEAEKPAFATCELRFPEPEPATDEPAHGATADDDPEDHDPAEEAAGDEPAADEDSAADDEEEH